MIVVEHDEDMMRAADHVIDMGPARACTAGGDGAGHLRRSAPNPQSLTGQYLSHAHDCRAQTRIALAARAGPARAGGRDQSQSRALSANRASKRRAERMAEHHARQGAGERCAWVVPRATI